MDSSSKLNEILYRELVVAGQELDALDDGYPEYDPELAGRVGYAEGYYDALRDIMSRIEGI